ncbi:hypothetical protein KIH74_30235 [Kineosporia sp. J2-2]|uniref:Guanylate cyclase domain-containing protein n=1 Tax=Kineosporia corallincola TaxID=2835133 RepID=A0ABS5TQA2_9ACTN|nr:hypothetical protein [Kineosporia corallincola]MBT0773262.1 hypothetical protein [Kineosporia corallincola]
MATGVRGVRRLCLVTDVERWTERDAAGKLETQQRLARMMIWACERVGVNPSAGDRQDRGDGQLLVFPPGIDEVRAVAGLIVHLRDALRSANDSPGPGGRMRLRVALAQGTVDVGPLGFVSRGVITACRLVDSPEVRKGLRDGKDCDLIAVLSDDLFRDVIDGQSVALRPSDFRPLRVRAKNHEKETVLAAWSHLPPRAAARGAGRRSYDPATPWGAGSAVALPALAAMAVWLPGHHWPGDDPDTPHPEPGESENPADDVHHGTTTAPHQPAPASTPTASVAEGQHHSSQVPGRPGIQPAPGVLVAALDEGADTWDTLDDIHDQDDEPDDDTPVWPDAQDDDPGDLSPDDLDDDGWYDLPDR